MLLLQPGHLLLDIETSGLNRQKDWVVCIGVGYLSSTGEMTYKQWHLQKPAEEKDLLISFFNFCINYQTIFTYNGKIFDWPFLQARLLFHQLDDTLFKKFLLVDMKKPLQYIDSKREQLEKSLGISRKAASSGRELVKLYKLFEDTGLAIYNQGILNHNSDELNSLFIFYEVYQTLFYLKSFKYTYNLKLPDVFLISYQLPYNLQTTLDCTLPQARISWTAKTQEVRIHFTVNTLTLKHYLSNYKDYYYVESNQQLVHNSLARFIPKELKRKASKEECFLTKENHYLKLYTTYRVNLPLWYDENKTAFITFEENTHFFDLIGAQLFYFFFQTQQPKD